MKMRTLQDPQGTGEADSSSEVSHEPQSDEQSNPRPDASTINSAGASTSCNGNHNKVSREDVELVQNLIERCLLLYMNRKEAVATLRTQAKIEPGFTYLVWQKLEEENADFFREYNIRLKLKNQIILFNNLLEHQYLLMMHPATPKAPSTPIQNGIHSMPVYNLPMGYPVMQQLAIAATGQPHLDSVGLSSYVVNGVPAPSNFHQLGVNSGNDALCFMPEMAMSSTAAPNGHFHFTESDTSGIGMDSAVLDLASTTDVGMTGGLHLGIEDTLRSDLWNYIGSPFLHEADIMLETDQNFVEEFFDDNMPSKSDEDTSLSLEPRAAVRLR